MAGVIGGVPRLPAASSKARLNRFNSGVGFKRAEQVTITGTVAIEIFTSDVADSTDLPNDPVDGKMVLLIPDAAARKVCIAYGGNWYAATTELLG